MIHHLSLPAQNPHHVAQILSELLGGRAMPFPDSPDSYIVFHSEPGLCIEVCPLRTTLIPGTDDQPVQVRSHISASPFSGFHAAISTSLCWSEIAAVAEREQWRAVLCRRKTQCYEIIEFWIENRFLLKLLTPEMVAQYNAFMRPQVWEEFFNLKLQFNAHSQHFYKQGT